MFAYTKIMQGIQAVSAVVTDAYFNLVTLLLPGNGTNGAQNNTFLDSSSNNFSITRNGNTTQGTFSPFSQTGWGNYFNGSSTYLSAAANNAFSFGTGNFTIEAWVYPTVGSVYRGIFANGGVSTGSFAVYLTNTNTVRLDYYGGGGVGTTTTVALNTWSHIVVARSGSTISIFINGTREATATTSDNNTSNACYVGASWGGASDYMQGYISNFRVVKGTAVYDPSLTTLTVPTSPLTAITNTSLLTCQSNRFIDNSTNAFSITLNGTPSVQAFSPFAPTAAYSAATNGGSGYFDSSGDYLSVGTAANWAFMSNSSALFSVEAWIYFISTGSDQTICCTNGGSSLNVGFALQIAATTNKLGFEITRGVSGSRVLTGSTTGALVPNAWNHVLFTYDQSLASNNCNVYINGASAETFSKTANAPSSSNPANPLYIGSTTGSAAMVYGYIGSMRISSVVRSSGIPTSPYTSDANTKLLANYTNGGIIDATGKNVLETVGNAQISTTQSKWGGSSISCPATNGNYCISPPNQPNLLFGTGQFTIEMWVYPTAFTNTAAGIIGYGLSGGYVDWNLELNTSGTLLYIDNDTGRVSASSNLSLNTWTHIAVVRTATAVTVYFNGTSVATYSTINNISGSSTSARLYVGTGAQVPASRQFIGFIDDLRITKGYARYTANFTPPTAAFALQ